MADGVNPRQGGTVKEENFVRKMLKSCFKGSADKLDGIYHDVFEVCSPFMSAFSSNSKEETKLKKIDDEMKETEVQQFSRDYLQNVVTNRSRTWAVETKDETPAKQQAVSCMEEFTSGCKQEQGFKDHHKDKLHGRCFVTPSATSCKIQTDRVQKDFANKKEDEQIIVGCTENQKKTPQFDHGALQHFEEMMRNGESVLNQRLADAVNVESDDHVHGKETNNEIDTTISSHDVITSQPFLKKDSKGQEEDCKRKFPEGNDNAASLNLSVDVIKEDSKMTGTAEHDESSSKTAESKQTNFKTENRNIPNAVIKGAASVIQEPSETKEDTGHNMAAIQSQDPMMKDKAGFAVNTEERKEGLVVVRKNSKGRMLWGKTFIVDKNKLDVKEYILAALKEILTGKTKQDQLLHVEVKGSLMVLDGFTFLLMLFVFVLFELQATPWTHSPNNDVLGDTLLALQELNNGDGNRTGGRSDSEDDLFHYAVNTSKKSDRRNEDEVCLKFWENDNKKSQKIEDLKPSSMKELKHGFFRFQNFHRLEVTVLAIPQYSLEYYALMMLNVANFSSRDVMCLELMRYSTLRNLPMTVSFPLALLSSGGHYYDQFSSEIRCYSCDFSSPVAFINLPNNRSSLINLHVPNCPHVAGTDRRNVPLHPAAPHNTSNQQNMAGAPGGFSEVRLGATLVVEEVNFAHSSQHREPDDDYREIRRLRQENKDLRQKITCKICWKRNVNLIFLPCGHLICCQHCWQSVKDKVGRCFICSSPITHTNICRW